MEANTKIDLSTQEEPSEPKPEAFNMPEGFMCLGEFPLFSDDGTYLAENANNMTILRDIYDNEDVYQWVTPGGKSIYLCIRIGAETRLMKRQAADQQRALGNTALADA